MFTARVTTAIIAVLLLGGCASSMSGSAYERRHARTAHEVQFGEVESVREVLIEGTKTPIGAAAGAGIGSAVGRTAGDSPLGRAVGGIAGAVVGGVAGAATEEAITRQKGYEITVRLDSGRYLAVVQAADEEFKPGERVRIVSGPGGTTRVTH